MGTDETIVIHCPHCNKKLSVSVRFQGATATCPACHHKFPFGGISPADLCKSRAAKLGYRFVDLNITEIPAGVLELVPAEVVREDKILPVSLDGDTLLVAVSDLRAQENVERLHFRLQRPLSIAMATEEALQAAIQRYYSPAVVAAAESPLAKREESGIEFTEMEPAALSDEHGDEHLHPGSGEVIQRVQQMITDALRLEATRVLLMPLKDVVKVAYWIQGAVHHREDLPPPLLHPMLVRLMTMANLQGTIKVSLGGKERRLHVTFKPTKAGLAALIEMPRDSSATEICKARAAKLGYRFVNLEETVIPPAVLALVPESVARQYKALPVAVEDNTLTVVLHDPRASEALEGIRFALAQPIAVAMAPEGALLVAIDRYYGVEDPETTELLGWELAQTQEAAPASATPNANRLIEQLDAAPHRLACPVLEHLRTLYRQKMFYLFESLRSASPLCRQDEATGNLEVVFPQSGLMPLLPAEARQYVEDKIWALREAIISRLENFLEKDPLARGAAMTYAQYLACCRLADGQAASINPATARDAWVNFLYALAMQAFPSIDSNGAMLALVTEHIDQLADRVASWIDDPLAVINPLTSRGWLTRLQSQTTTDEPVDFDSPPIIHLLEWLIAEAVQVRASRIVLLPWDERVEVAYRVQSTAYRRDNLPLRLLYPILARLTVLGAAAGEFAVVNGRKKRRLRVTFRPTDRGLAAVLETLTDPAEARACKERAAKQGYEFVELEQIHIPPPILSLVPKAIAWKKGVLPLAVQGTVLTIVVSEPPGQRKKDELRLVFNRPISIAMATEDDILAAIYRHYHPAPAQPAVSPQALALLR